MTTGLYSDRSVNLTIDVLSGTAERLMTYGAECITLEILLRNEWRFWLVTVRADQVSGQPSQLQAPSAIEGSESSDLWMVG